MKRPITYYLKSLLLLAAVLCVSMPAWSLDVSKLATCGDESADATPVMLKAPSLREIHLRGDSNCDGIVDINDVTALINTVLTGRALPNGDVNNDGFIDINDVTELISMVLNGAPKYDVAAGIEALNDIYRSMRVFGWSTTGNYHQAFGISAYNLMAEVMGDDMIMGSMGYGWFWYDAGYNVKRYYTSTSWRSYDLWNAYYTWIANANYILAASQSMTGATTDVNYVKGQAYAIRAYSYFMLAQSFARTYKGHEYDPCVPLFTGTVFGGSTGAPRSTVAEVYAQIDADIDQAVTLLNGTTQQVPDHIGYAVALGLRARIALVKEAFPRAYLDARNAIEASGKTILEVSDFQGVNDAYADNVMWGAAIPAEEAAGVGSFWSHMSSTDGYGAMAPKLISLWLHDKMSATDARQAWWRPNDTGNGPEGYVQQKFSMKEGTAWEGDYIWMRVEEMYLTAAEAACRGNMGTTAKQYLNDLMAKRDPNYSCDKTGTELTTLTSPADTAATGSLLEEILIQRRLELWGEDGRIYTIRRLHQGFERTVENGWPNALLLQNHSLQDPESYPWVMTIPITEFTGNDQMSLNTDQNPLGDYPEEHATDPQNVTFVQAVQTVQNPDKSYTVGVRLRRASTEGEYYSIVRLSATADMANHVSLYSSGVIHFSPGSDETMTYLTFSGMEMGQVYYADLSLSQADIDNTDPELGSTITATRVVMRCENGNPTGQNISFQTASIEESFAGVTKRVPVTIHRDRVDDAYAVDLVFSEEDGHETLYDTRLVFNEGGSTFTTFVDFSDLTDGETYSCVISLVPVDGSASDPAINGITSMRITLKSQNWISAGTCTFIDNTWNDDQIAYNVPVEQNENSNEYRIVAPWYLVYNDIYGDCGEDNWYFTLNNDGSITPVEGVWDINYGGYYGYFSTSYPSYCYINQEDNTYDVYFILQQASTGNMYSGGHFTFTWDR